MEGGRGGEAGGMKGVRDYPEVSLDVTVRRDPSVYSLEPFSKNSYLLEFRTVISGHDRPKPVHDRSCPSVRTSFGTSYRWTGVLHFLEQGPTRLQSSESGLDRPLFPTVT